MAVRVGLIDGRVSLDELAEELAASSSARGGGALVVFMGFVKGVVSGAEVEELVYEAHPRYAEEKLREIGEWAEQHFRLHDVVLLHRVGRLKPGEPTIYILVTAASRHEAFQAAQQILERVKHEAPIYKLERRADGEYWVMGNGRRLPRPTLPPG